MSPRLLKKLRELRLSMGIVEGTFDRWTISHGGTSARIDVLEIMLVDQYCDRVYG